MSSRLCPPSVQPAYMQRMTSGLKAEGKVQCRHIGGDHRAYLPSVILVEKGKHVSLYCPLQLVAGTAFDNGKAFLSRYHWRSGNLKRTPHESLAFLDVVCTRSLCLLSQTLSLRLFAFGG